MTTKDNFIYFLIPCLWFIPEIYKPSLLLKKMGISKYNYLYFTNFVDTGFAFIVYLLLYEARFSRNKSWQKMCRQALGAIIGLGIPLVIYQIYYS